ncbi:SnoaL-like domain protein [Rubripirellula tenax]|uniref:SnoaL-like domain protein n=1 Tax=Rubripirellula tenax TaxID=2528015 RepID=A0A5C6FD96_9BACT|nr:nuclear transport factor 2 family protein [Rubripirellula tenax]TWU58560.1 SnoaL-like domain protein [Rubripirellula tenax]
MNRLILGAGFLWIVAGIAAADDNAVNQAIGRYQDAFNRQDVSLIETLWFEAAVLEDASAQTNLTGREAIIGQLKDAFAQDIPPTLSIETDSVAVQADGSILVTGTNTLTSGDSAEPNRESFAFTAALRSINGKWQITKVTETTIDDGENQASPSPLQTIKWLVGAWSAASDASADESVGNQIVNEFRLVPGDRFMVRTFGTEGASSQDSPGYQMIGTLPGEQQLRSWTFLGDGSVSQGKWIVESERILIESSGRLADGSEAAGTYVLNRIDDNTMTMKVVGHTINGEPVPSMGTVTLTRQTTTQETQP